MRIAILEDDPDQANLLAAWLEDDGHSAHIFLTAEKFRKEFLRESYDLLVLDWELPTSSGIEVLAWVRENADWYIPVLFTTVRDQQEDIVRALDAGADDYIIKPISQQIILARVHALLRRSHKKADADHVLQQGEFIFDTQVGSVTRNGESIVLTEREFKLAVMLFRSIDQIVSRGHILENIWGIAADVPTRTIDTHISRIRQKLHLLPEYGWKIRAVYQHGYRLESVTDNG